MRRIIQRLFLVAYVAVAIWVPAEIVWNEYSADRDPWPLKCGYEYEFVGYPTMLVKRNGDTLVAVGYRRSFRGGRSIEFMLDGKPLRLIETTQPRWRCR